MRSSILVLAVFFLLLSCTKKEGTEEVKPPIYIPPTTLASPPDSLLLPAVYKKYINANGIPLLSSTLTEDEALFRASSTVLLMLRNLDTATYNRMLRKRTRVVIVSYQEELSVIPEFSTVTANFVADRRGLFFNNITSVFEENLLCERNLRADNNKERDMVTHEFAHAIHLDGGDKNLDSSIRSVYQKAMKNKQWQGFYAATNYKEYWAEGVSFWFNCIPDRILASGTSQRERLKNYDPELYSLIQRYFSDAISKTGCY
jgi:alpha-glucosidase